MALVSRTFAEYYHALITREPLPDELLKRVYREETGERKRIEAELDAAVNDLRHVIGIMIGERKKNRDTQSCRQITYDKHTLKVMEQEKAVWLPPIPPRSVMPPRRRFFLDSHLQNTTDLLKKNRSCVTGFLLWKHASVFLLKRRVPIHGFFCCAFTSAMSKKLMVVLVWSVKKTRNASVFVVTCSVWHHRTTSATFGWSDMGPSLSQRRRHFMNCVKNLVRLLKMKNRMIGAV
ncbi:hypothetical protein C3747_55g2 [Trypanosoma cruzi]|uniref:Uncharacterized protein n=1 Tax=Trypanosoma cruzi TaxID=5693 RepID=A0A2V2WZF1_TRYCR|nr:hypothetical protein C3747_55g2 [Trypanosoma cruzi]